MTKYVSLEKYPEIKKFLHAESYREDIVMTANRAVPTSEPISLKCPDCYTIFIMKSKKIRENRNNLCPNCGDNKLSLAKPISQTEWSKFWDYDKNTESPRYVSISTHTKYYWKCDKGHEWFKSPDHMSRLDNFCTECYKESVQKKKESQIAKHKDIQKEKQKEAVKHNKVKKDKKRKKTIKLEDTAGYKFPELLKDIDNNKNNINLYEVTPGSRKRVNWKCHKCGYEWNTTINNRTLLGRKCAVCSGTKIVPHINDAATLYPEIIPFWNHEVNLIDIHTVNKHSTVRYSWKCDKGHVFEKRIIAMINNPTCLICRGRISSGEIAIGEYVSSIVPDSMIIKNSRSIIPPLELDIYLPEYNLAIEYNGLYWHSNNFKKDIYYHYNKWKQCKEKGIKLLSIWEDDWNYKQELVKKLIYENIYHNVIQQADSTMFSIVTIPTDIAQQFYMEHSIENFTDGKTYIGIIDNHNDLHAVITYSIIENALTIDNYCTINNYVDYLSLMMNHLISIAYDNHCTIIIAQSRNDYHDGAVYVNNGFRLNNSILINHYKVDNDKKYLCDSHYDSYTVTDSGYSVWGVSL